MLYDDYIKEYYERMKKNLTPDEVDTKLFVYGTLKKGFGNHAVIESIDSKFLDFGMIKGYDIYSLGAFPAVKDSNDKESFVMGELYHMDNLLATDMLEGYPHMYNRKKTNVYTRDNGIQEAWVYIYNGDLKDKKPLESKEWVRFINRR